MMWGVEKRCPWRRRFAASDQRSHKWSGAPLLPSAALVSPAIKIFLAPPCMPPPPSGLPR
jgi:hypothetical protein